MEISTCFEVNGTMVANDFIDRYMAAANGEYVKVYLYILRHQSERMDITRIADALNHTESDVRRALSYWEKIGALRLGGAGQTAPASQQSAACPADQTAATKTAALQPRPADISRLSSDEDFSQLLYIAQKYMNKIFTQRECEVFAYLYDGLHMSAELLEYLVEYCVQGGHTSIRYIETVAVSWHEKGFATVDEARAYTSTFTKNSFAVMRAFGLSDRKPGDAEKEMIERWFVTYGFSRDVVLEACRRTLEATHAPSFRYAEKILSEWKKAGVRHLGDVTALDEKRQSQAKRGAAKKTSGQNSFHNFEQRDTDYDAMVMDRVKAWIEES